AINGVNSRLDTVIAGSSAHHKLLAKEAAKRERDLEKVRRRLQQGIVPTEGDFYVGTVLVKADALDQLEELRDRDLEAEFSLTGLPCRLVQISGQSGIAGFGSAERPQEGHGLLQHEAAGLPQGPLLRECGVEGGQWPPVLLDGDDKKLPKHACLRLVVPDIIRIAKAKLPVVEVLEERPAKRRAVEPAPGKPQAPPAREAKKDDLWEVVEDGSTTAPSTEAEVPEPTEQPVTNEPAVKFGLPPSPGAWFQYVQNAIWGARQPDIVATLINPQDADVVATWSQDRGLPRILLREKGEIYVSAQFLQAHCKKLSLEGSPRSQRERSRSPRRCKHAAEEEQAEAAQPAEVPEAEPAAVAEPESALPDADAKPAEEPEHKPADAKPAEDAKPKRCLENQHREQGLVGEIRGKWLELYLDDKAIYDDARVRVESGFLDGWVLDCEMILGFEVTQLKELPKFGCFKPGARIRVLIRSLVDKVE
ncbi:arcC, partial [Symbiodinium microadriaticum]